MLQCVIEHVPKKSIVLELGNSDETKGLCKFFTVIRGEIPPHFSLLIVNDSHKHELLENIDLFGPLHDIVVVLINVDDNNANIVYNILQNTHNRDYSSNLYLFLPKPPGIIGIGEIGSSIEKIIGKKALKVDVNKNMNDDLSECAIIHVCIPYDANFEQTVLNYYEKNKTALYIIHSTTKPGTTLKLHNLGVKCVHSPIRGIHPYLLESIQTFEKFLGSDSLEAVKIAERNLLLSLKVPSVKVCKNSTTTEVMKVLSTTYYGTCIIFHAQCADYCEKNGVDFEEAVTWANLTYNEGYKKMGKEQFVRPVLYAPKGKIGGHCVVPNAQLIKDEMDFAKKIAEYNDK